MLSTEEGKPVDREQREVMIGFLGLSDTYCSLLTVGYFRFKVSRFSALLFASLLPFDQLEVVRD